MLNQFQNYLVTHPGKHRLNQKPSEDLTGAYNVHDSGCPTCPNEASRTQKEKQMEVSDFS